MKLIEAEELLSVQPVHHPAHLHPTQTGHFTTTHPSDTMVMVFSTRMDPVLLFAAWHPQTAAQYTLSLMLIFGLAVLHEWLVRQKRLCDARHRSAAHGEALPLFRAATLSRSERVHTITRILAAMCLHAASVTTSFLLMLLIMSFNVGVFTAVVAGLSVGHAIFGAAIAPHSSSRHRDLKDEDSEPEAFSHAHA